MCPLCITAGTLYLASTGAAGSAGGLAAVAAKVMRRRKGRKGAPMSNAAGPVARPDLTLRPRQR
jgi:hypothetical protein